MDVQKMIDRGIAEGRSPKDAFLNTCASAQFCYGYARPDDREAKRVHKKLWDLAPTYGVTR